MAQYHQPYDPNYRRDIEEMSSEDEFEIAVDAIHPRLSSVHYSCIRCKGKFDSKKILFLHFKSGCCVRCRKCGKEVYEKVLRGKVVLGQKCSKRCIPDFNQ